MIYKASDMIKFRLKRIGLFTLYMTSFVLLAFSNLPSYTQDLESDQLTDAADFFFRECYRSEGIREVDCTNIRDFAIKIYPDEVERCYVNYSDDVQLYNKCIQEHVDDPLQIKSDVLYSMELICAYSLRDDLTCSSLSCFTYEQSPYECVTWSKSIMADEPTVAYSCLLDLMEPANEPDSSEDTASIDFSELADDYVLCVGSNSSRYPQDYTLDITIVPLNPTLPPIFTSVPTLNETELARLLGTREAVPTVPPTFTPFFRSSPTNTISAPTQNVTPTLITATPGADSGIINTLIPSTPEPQFNAPTSTFTPQPTLFQPTVAVNPDLLVAPIEPPTTGQSTFTTVGAGAYQYDVGLGGVFSFNNIQLSGGVSLFAPNPVDPSSFMRTNQFGMLLYKPIGSPNETVMNNIPFFDGFTAPSSEGNKNRVLEIDWSADGQRLSFRIDTPHGLDNGAAGVWFWQPSIGDDQTGPTYQIIRDCVEPGYTPCQFVSGSNASFWKTIGVEWSPNPGSYSVLLTLNLPQEGRNALAITQAVRDANYSQQAPTFFRYDYGYWLNNGQRIIVSGRRPDGRVIIGTVNSALTGEEVILDASSIGLWVQNAVQRPSGQVVALGRPGDANSGGPVALYDSNGNAISAPIGSVAPEDVRWYPDRSAVVVSVQGRQYTVRVDDGIINDTTDLARNPSFGSGGGGSSAIPQGVIQGSEYLPGQQMRIITTNLNIRQDPSTGSLIQGGLVQGDYIAILAGPYDSEGFQWWKVQTATNIVGWIPGKINSTPTIAPA
jgi:hypothetical protein